MRRVLAAVLQRCSAAAVQSAGWRWRSFGGGAAGVPRRPALDQPPSLQQQRTREGARAHELENRSDAPRSRRPAHSCALRLTRAPLTRTHLGPTAAATPPTGRAAAAEFGGCAAARPPTVRSPSTSGPCAGGAVAEAVSARDGGDVAGCAPAGGGARERRRPSARHHRASAGRPAPGPVKRRRTDSPSPPPVRASPGQRGGNATPNRSDGAGGDWDGVSPDGAIKKGTWAPAEDALLRNLVDEHGARRYAPARARARPPTTTPSPLHTPREARAKLRGAAAFEMPPSHPPPLPDPPPPPPHPTPPPRRAQWAMIATKMPGRTGKQCRERWHNHLDPSIAKERWTEEENEIVIDAHRVRGNQARPPPASPALPNPPP